MYYTLFIICHWFGPPAGDFQSIWEAVPGDRTISQKAEPDGDGLTVHLPECPLYEKPETPAEIEGSMLLAVEGNWDSCAWESCIKLDISFWTVQVL